MPIAHGIWSGRTSAAKRTSLLTKIWRMTELCGLNPLTRVNHSEAYQDGIRRSTNIIEPFFSCVRRSYRGIHHRFSMTYLDW